MNTEQIKNIPSHIIDEMLRDVKFTTLLNPFAGEGVLGDVLRKKMNQIVRGYGGEPDLDCIEQDPQNAQVLKEKNYRVIHDDFLTFNSFKNYDTIIMDISQTDGIPQLLKAFQMQHRGGTIVCLLDAKIFKVPYNEERQSFLNLLDNFSDWTVKYFKIDCDENAEVALFKISIPYHTPRSFFRTELERAFKQKEPKKQDEFYQLAENDAIAQAVKHFEIEAEMGIKLLQEFEGMKPYLLSSYDKTRWVGSTLLQMKVQTIEGRKEEATVNLFLKNLRYKYWENLFANPSFTEQYTTEMRYKLSERLEKLVDYDFSYYNIKNIQIEMIKGLNENLEKVVLEVFDELSARYAYSSYSKNVHYYNGWSTNKSWFVNKKVIIPFRVYSSLTGYFDIIEVERRLNDFEKALSFLNGNKPLEINIRQTLEKAREIGEFKNIELNFFTVTFFKKGTAWITFKDTDLLQRLNQFAGKRRAWLPPTYGKKNYSEMSVNEQSIINEFEGSKNYGEMMQNSELSFLDLPNSVNSND